MNSRKLIVGNWKMHPASVDDAKRIARRTRLVASRLEHTDVVACPPFPFMQACASRRPTANFYIGAQSVSVHEEGAHTGEAGAGMLRSLGATYAIVGHSEQRAAGDSDEIVSHRLARVVEAGLTAILCVGERTRDESGAHFDVVRDQIKGSLAGLPEGKARSVIMAYEPVWEIGAKEAMAPEEVHEMSIFVKKAFSDIFGPEAGLKAKVLYGGSVNFRNAVEIIHTGQVDGLLVGRESVNLPGFTELLKEVDKIQ